MIHTSIFDALPESAAAIVRTRFSDVLSGRDTSPKYAHLSSSDREAILAILTETKPGLRITR
jgi:hypothetical protein